MTMPSDSTHENIRERSFLDQCHLYLTGFERPHLAPIKRRIDNVVSFSNEVLVKTIPGCLDFVDISEGRGLLSPDDENDTLIRRESLKGSRTWSDLDVNSEHYRRMPRPVPQRPLHPEVAKQRRQGRVPASI
jgi:hypothetical protein